MVIWVVPFYVTFAVSYVYPVLLPYAIPLGLGVTISGLFWQIVVNQYQAQQYNLIVMLIDRLPKSLGINFREYWSWDSAVQLWIRGQPREEVDPLPDSKGRYWRTAYLPLLNNGIVHPSYNKGEHIRYVVFRYCQGTWNDLVRYAAGEGYFRGSVVDMKNVCRIWVTEIVSEALPDPSGKTGKELLNLIPALIRDPEDSVMKYVPWFIIQRADGSVNIELQKEERLSRLRAQAMKERLEEKELQKLEEEKRKMAVAPVVS